MSLPAGSPDLPPSLRNLALAYFDYGFTVIPVHPRSKRPAGKGWQKQQLTRDDVERLWSANPKYNIGLLCGQGGWVAIDCDGEDWAAWAADHFPDTPLRTISGSGTGGHLIYRWPKGVSVKTGCGQRKVYTSVRGQVYTKPALIRP